MAEKKEKQIPVNEVINLRNQGFSNTQVIENLRKQNYSFQQISDALNQSEIKASVNQPDSELPEAPSPSSAYDLESATINSPKASQDYTKTYSELQPLQQAPEYSSFSGTSEKDSYAEKIEEIAESVIKEKWDDFVREIGDINVWKEKIRTDILSIKQEIVRTHERFENLQRGVLGKVSEYDKDVREIGSEIKALEKVLEKIIEPLTTNIKDLQKVTQELKSRKKK